MCDIEKHIKELLVKGYITEDLAPVKCLRCDSKEFTDVEEYYENHYRVEYQVQCKNCGMINGHWAYGNWQI